MKFDHIEVNGILNIVINRKVQWTLNDHEQWHSNTGSLRTHAEMMRIVNEIKKDRRFRMWIHHDTLNIVRKQSPTPKFGTVVQTRNFGAGMMQFTSPK